MIPALLLPLVTLLPLAPDSEGASCVPDDVFATPSGDLVLVVDADGESETMLTVVEEYARLTGQPVVLDPKSRDYLKELPTGLSRDTVVPPVGVQSFVEGLLANYGCALVVRPGTPRSILIQTSRSEYRQWIREGSLHVDEAHLAAWRGYPATQIRCTVSLEHEDARQVANSLRMEGVDSNRHLVLPIGSGRAISVSGGGRWVGDMVAAIRAADDAVAAAEKAEFGRVALSHAVATDLAPLLQELLDAANGRGVGPTQQGMPPVVLVRVVADERTNSILVVGSAEDLAAARQLIATLDVPVSAR